MKKSIFSSVFLLAIIVAVSSCKKEETPVEYDCTGLTPTYTADIKPILDASCASAGCHSSVNPSEDIDLSTYASTKEHGNEDHFLGSIQHLSGYEPMPNGQPKLSDEIIKKISCWVQNGMPE